MKSRRSGKRPNASTKAISEKADQNDRLISLSAPLRGNETEIYICYTRKQLRRGAPIDVALDDMYLGDMTPAEMTAKGRVFHPTILSFATILFGSQHHQASITDQGYALHGVALKQLNQALTHSQCYTRDDVLLSVVSLAILECLVPTGQKHYLNHMIGLERLLELRDPWTYSSARTCELYKSVRHMLIFASLRTGRPSIFARPEWKTVLRANCSDEEIPEQDLFDVLADCTVLIAERNTMLATEDSDFERSTNQRDNLKQTAAGLLKSLHAWKVQWDNDERNAYSEPSTVPKDARKTFQSLNSAPLTGFEFAQDHAALMLMFYKTTFIYVLRALASLPVNDAVPNSQEWESPKSSPIADPSDLNAAQRSAAIDVCRCIPHYLARSAGCDSDASPIVHWAVTTAWMTLGGNESTEGSWLMDMLKNASRTVIAQALWSS